METNLSCPYLDGYCKKDRCAAWGPAIVIDANMEHHIVDRMCIRVAHDQIEMHNAFIAWRDATCNAADQAVISISKAKSGPVKDTSSEIFREDLLTALDDIRYAIQGKTKSEG
jgi:hypothetical protein